MNAKLNKRERRSAQLLAHYATCERLAQAIGMPGKIDGKRISVALWRIEQFAHERATSYCNGRSENGVSFCSDDWQIAKEIIGKMIAGVFDTTPPAFFVNGDARGYALKIDNEKPEGRALIEAAKLHKDWGGFGILSPEITGD